MEGDCNDLEGDRQQGREYEGYINIDPVWTGPSRSNDESSDILDFLLLRWNAGIDVHSGVHDGDASQRDFSQDMAQENGYNDMRNDAYPDQTKPSSQQQKAAWDTNGDGKLQKSEADQWYLHGNGVTINVDNSKIDWSGLKMPVSGSPQFAISTTDAFISLPWETSSTYGGTSFERINPTTAIVKDQLYHYNLLPNNSLQNVARNFMNEAGKPGGTNYGGQHGNTKGTKEGKPFMIHYLNPTIKFNSK